MKNSIKSLLDAFIRDSAQYVKENGGNVAEYIIADAESRDQGWLFFLTEEEAEEYENSDSDRRDEIQSEIRAFINENYNYNLLADDLLEEWIVVDFGPDTEDRYRVTQRSNFEEMDFCKAYESNGAQIGCYYASCYSFENSSLRIFEDFYEALNKKGFGIGSLMDDNELTYSELVEMLESKDEYDRGIQIFGNEFSQMVEFFKSWREANETHTKVKGWTFHDSHNFCTVIMEADFGEVDCNELDENEQKEILLQMPKTFPHIESTETSEETEDFIFHFDRWATNPWYCSVERK